MATHQTLGAQAARQLANTTKTLPQWIGVTPRWLVGLLPWTPVEAGTYRVNKVKAAAEDAIAIACSPSDDDLVPNTFIDYEEVPREYTLSTVTTTIDVHTRVSDLYRSPMDQVREQLGVLIEMVKERQENELINNPSYGLSSSVADVGAGDEILITWLEHHANIVPWQMLCRERGARLCVAPVDDDGQVILEEFERLLGPRTRLVAFAHVSNALGTIVPARQLVEMAHRHGARVLVDGAQAVSHQRVDVQALDADLYVFSGHKIFAPTGIGVLYGKSDVLDAMPPWQGGGNMIDDVTIEKTSYRPAPDRFEAGTGNIADAVGLGAALDYVSGLGLENIARHEHELLVYATERLRAIPGLRLFGNAPDKAAVLSFLLEVHAPEDVGKALDQEGIAVRAGHHCAQPILRRFGVEATVRASLAPYNTRDDVDALVDALKRLQSGHL